MKHAISIVVFFAAAAGLALAQGKPAPAPLPPLAPRISLAEANSLVALAQTAMLGYISDRTPAGAVPVPKELKVLDAQKYAVAMRLRSEVKVADVVIEAGGETCRNVVAAALKAMRSPELPDRITAAVVKGFQIELEVLGPPEMISEADIPKPVNPGLTGLKLYQGGYEAMVLPSFAYENGLDANRIRAACAGQIPQERDILARPRQWAVFAASHYVGYPDGRTVWLYRGKELAPWDSIGDKDSPFPAEAERIGRFLMMNQLPTGAYAVAGQPASQREHLHAAYAMAELASLGQNKAFADSLTGAMVYARGYVRQSNDRAYIATDDAGEELAATCWMALATAKSPDADKASELKRRLLAAITGAMDKDNMPSVRLDGTSSGPAPLKDAWLAYRAMTALGLKDEGDSQPARLRGAIEKPSLADDQARLWMHWALGANVSPAQAEQFIAMPTADQAAPADERGGVLAGGPRPATGATALYAVGLAGLKQPKAAEKLLDARRFCCQMIYRQREAYFALSPDLWPGGVRAEPQYQAISLDASALAVEALLAGK